MKFKTVSTFIMLLGLLSVHSASAASKNKQENVNQLVNKFTQSSFRELIEKRHFKVAKNENRPIYFDKEGHTYNQTLVFKTKRGFMCQGGLSFEVSLDKRVEKDTLWTNLSCYKIKTSRKTKRRKRRKS